MALSFILGLWRPIIVNQARLPLLQILQGSFLRPSKGALEGVLRGELLLLFDAEDVVRFATTLLPSIFPG